MRISDWSSDVCSSDLAHVEAQLGLPRGQMKVTVLVETLPAAFEMDEILHALRERIVGLNCGRWDYIFYYIKTLRAHGDRVLPERAQVTMQIGSAEGREVGCEAVSNPVSACTLQKKKDER